MQKKRILIFIDWFEPAYKAGGPIRSVVNLVHSLESSYDIFVFTSNKDLGDAVPMLGVQSNQWVNYSKTAKVFYAGSNRLGLRSIWKEIRKVQPDYIYCNSLFSFWFSIYPILLKRLGLIKFPVILAPKGMLRASALKFKSTKKKIFLRVFRFLGIPKIIDFHATDLEEATSIENSFGKVSIYPILDSPAALPRQISRIEKKQGSLRILFVGRIHPIKQLDVVLNCLLEQTAQIVLTVVGVVEDDLYWKKCRSIIENLPQNVEVKIISAVQHFELAAIINDHHILFLPTLGENFGHAIYEALGAGRPVLISDQTIWRYLSIAEAGWDISLHDKNRYSLILKEIVNWNQDTFAVWSKGAREFVEEYLIKNEPLSAYKNYSNNMYILGLNAYHADSSAAIFKDGIMLAAIEEERFRRIKHWAGFPSMAIEFCLKEAGITLAEVDHIAIGRDPKAKLRKKMAFLLKNPGGGFNAVLDRVKNARKVTSLEDEFAKIDPSIDKAALKAKIHNAEHHRSHLASAFFASPFEEAALLSIDGSGDFTTTMIGIGRGNQIEVIDSVDFPHSVGLFYTALTQLLGFPHYGDEYKVMGLAPYGEPKYVEQLKEILQFKKNGLFELDLSCFRSAKHGIISYGEDHIPVVAPLYSEKMIAKFGKVRAKDEPLTQYHKDMAASVQRVTEELEFHILNHLQKRTGLEQVCIAGGVAQNSVANGKITRQTSFKQVYIPSAGHDAGISMGAALYVYNQVLKQPRAAAVWSAYTGSHFNNEEIETYLQSRKISYKRYSDEELYEVVADRLINAGVIGWFSGKAEFGPRALGGRSILADPRRNDAKDLLNAKIKRRESFRPFAPSILKEYVAEYFEVNDNVPFMEKVFPIRKEKYGIIPAVTHADGTGRLQSVDAAVAPRYYKLIDAFRRKSGVPILLNTSFNENEPIVNSPEHALDCYLRTSMDMLVLENCVVSR